ncbi:hypothetical protein ACW9KT_15445 [Hymenobacter sp. HD11105]
MKKTPTPKPYHVQAKLSEAAKAALKREKGRRLQENVEISLPELVSEIVEKWAASAP